MADQHSAKSIPPAPPRRSAPPLCTKTRRSALANIGAMMPTAWKFILVALAGWIHRKQEDVIEYLREENRVLREQLGPARLRFTDAQRRRLAAKAKALGWRELRDVATLVTPKTLLGWY